MSENSPPHVSTPGGSSRFPWAILVSALLALFVIGGFLAIWQFLAPADRKIATSYTDFINEVHAGHVSEIHMKDRDIDYRVRSEDGRMPTMRHTTGPVPDQAFIDTLKPTDPLALPPKITFQK